MGYMKKDGKMILVTGKKGRKLVIGMSVKLTITTALDLAKQRDLKRRSVIYLIFLNKDLIYCLVDSLKQIFIMSLKFCKSLLEE